MLPEGSVRVHVHCDSHFATLPPRSHNLTNPFSLQNCALVVIYKFYPVVTSWSNVISLNFFPFFQIPLTRTAKGSKNLLLTKQWPTFLGVNIDISRKSPMTRSDQWENIHCPPIWYGGVSGLNTSFPQWYLQFWFIHSFKNFEATLTLEFLIIKTSLGGCGYFQEPHNYNNFNLEANGQCQLWSDFDHVMQYQNFLLQLFMDTKNTSTGQFTMPNLVHTRYWSFKGITFLCKNWQVWGDGPHIFYTIAKDW